MSCADIAATVKPSTTAVSVNGVVISRDAIAREIQHHPADTPAAAWREAAQALIIRRLLLDETCRLGLEAAPIEDSEGRCETEEEALIRQLIEGEVKTPTPDEAACRRYYGQNLKRFRSADLFEAEHILFAAAPSDPAARAQAIGDAQATIDALRAEPDRFAELARAESACPSSQRGGDLGQITRGTTTVEFDKALTALRPGETTAEPVETRFGFHVIRLRARFEGRELPFEEVREHIADYLAESVERRALAQYVSILVRAANIAGVDLGSHHIGAPRQRDCR